MNKELEKIIKKLNGNLIGIGIKEEKIIKLIEKNQNILECNLLDCFENDLKSKTKNKKLKIKKLRKKFGKRKTNYMICNFERIKDIQNKIIYDSIYICNNEIIIYDSSKKELENLLRRYNRYSDIETIKSENGNIYKIHIKKNISFFNEIFNKMKDEIINIVDFISNLLV